MILSSPQPVRHPSPVGFFLIWPPESNMTVYIRTHITFLSVNILRTEHFSYCHIFSVSFTVFKLARKNYDVTIQLPTSFFFYL